MEQLFFNSCLGAFTAFHRAFGILVMIGLLLWLMSGRRLDPGSYLNSFLKTCLFVFKKLMKLSEGLAKMTAALLPNSRAHLRPIVHLVSHCGYSILTIAFVMFSVSQCTQPPGQYVATRHQTVR